MTRVRPSVLLLLSILGIVSCSTSPAVQESGPVRLGMFADLSSTGARDGNDALKGAQLLIKEVNSAGGINGRLIRLQVMDTKENPADAVKAYIALAQEGGVCAVIGSATAAAGLAVSPVADLVRVPLVALGIDSRVTTPEMMPENPETVGVLRKFTFMIQPSSVQIAAAMASYAIEHFPLALVAALFDPSDAMSSLQQRMFSSVARKAGKIVAGAVELPQGGSDIAVPLAKIRDMGVDAVFVCGSAEENAAVALKARDTAFLPALLGNQSWYPGPGATANAAENGVWFCMGIAPDDSSLADIREKFRAEYGTLPRPAVVPGWDAAALAVAAVRRAGSTNPQKVHDALEQMNRFISLRGQLEMDRRTHRLAGQPVAIMRIIDGRSVTVEARYIPRETRKGAQP
jgi:branched-chain amino acid transport system substrate-binding protein